MKKDDSTTNYWTICHDCNGIGKKNRKFNKKVQLQLRQEIAQYEKDKAAGIPSIQPNLHLQTCPICSGSGLIASESCPLPNKDKFPHIAIIGGGIGGVALAVACLHRQIPFTLYERDTCFDVRSQGYGLTLQQASKAIKGFGLFHLKEGVNSTRHLVHTPEGKVIGEWGMRKSLEHKKKTTPKRTNVHIARQSLRKALLAQLGGESTVQWGHQLVDIKSTLNQNVALTFQVNKSIINTNADIVVGADGIRSTVRKLLLGDEITPLRYLGCIVILGICPLERLKNTESHLLDGATVFQTANGNERIYIMPFTDDSVMWQLSFPMPENEAKTLSAQGAAALKAEACRRIPWHNPIPQILASTHADQISGYPVYDRALIDQEILETIGNTTLIGDAAHPMSPFKGQGANQALLDALSLAREITNTCVTADWKTNGIRPSILRAFESEMLERSATKVKASEIAAQLLHSEMVLDEGDRPRGRFLKKHDDDEIL